MAPDPLKTTTASEPATLPTLARWVALLEEPKMIPPIKHCYNGIKVEVDINGNGLIMTFLFSEGRSVEFRVSDPDEAIIACLVTDDTDTRRSMFSPYNLKPVKTVITEQIFRDFTGSDPIHDDLERCNCPHQGEFGHQLCGWCKTHDKPRFVCGCTIPLRS